MSKRHIKEKPSVHHEGCWKAVTKKEVEKSDMANGIWK